VALLTGDDQLMAQCAAMFPGAQCVTVKHAVGQRAARSVSTVRACEAIRAGAEAAVRGLSGCRPTVIEAPYRLEIDLTMAAIADQAAIIPGAERVAARTVAFQAGSMADVLGWINTISALSASLR
jgi:D-amino peptidase